ncbi:type 1 glutamine amidotransferase domain-containing protein [Nonlabens antarcticus]|uniref:type 1 glutamine amidotransferase domain-containing protein n=1 Tax=Nonlabens antarcticus TaxID=392714 RepID=UPI0018913AD3|nr:type 1 glutamine amidotransferase domain-containing protein [Nonlabens antarcticus]
MNKNVAILATNGFEESELVSPKKALEDAGATVHIVSPEKGEIKAWKDGNWSNSYKVDKHISEVSVNDYNALMLPGGVINPDKLRTDKASVDFIKAFFEHKKPVSAICHGPQSLIEADVVKGRKMTSYHSIRKDLENAGAQWEDKEVVCDQGFVTSRTPDDLPAFNKKMIEELKEGKHDRQHA